MITIKDILDEACKGIYGHTNWEYVTTTDVDAHGTCIFFFSAPEEKESGDE